MLYNMLNLKIIKTGMFKYKNNSVLVFLFFFLIIFNVIYEAASRRHKEAYEVIVANEDSS